MLTRTRKNAILLYLYGEIYDGYVKDLKSIQGDKYIRDTWAYLNEIYIESVNHIVHVEIITDTQFTDYIKRNYKWKLPAFRVADFIDIKARIAQVVEGSTRNKIDSNSMIEDINVKQIDKK